MNEQETAGKIVDALTDELASEVSQGLLLKNAKKRLLAIYQTDELVEKLLRIVEIKANNFMHYTAH